MGWLHQQGVKRYATFNTLVFTKELAAVEQSLGITRGNLGQTNKKPAYISRLAFEPPLPESEDFFHVNYLLP